MIDRGCRRGKVYSYFAEVVMDRGMVAADQDPSLMS